MMRTLGLSLGILLLFLPGTGDARDLDLHALWDNRCAECHGHSAEFARKYLKPADGLLQGRHHIKDLRLFLENHYSPKEQVDAIYQMLLAQTGTPPRFREECRSCHGKASDFVRSSISLKENKLIIRESGVYVEHFMQRHRGLTQEDIQFYMALFTRLAREIYRP